MRTIKIKVTMDTGFSGATHRDIIDVDVGDDATPQEIEDAKDEALKEWAWNFIDLYHEEVR